MDAIRVQGLAEFRRALRGASAEAPKQLRVAHNEAAEIVVGWARPRIPSTSGRARASVRVASTQSRSRVRGGGRRVPYYPWLDFGGRVGKGRSVIREFRKDGRYIYAAYYANSAEFREVLANAMRRVATGQGWDVTSG